MYLSLVFSHPLASEAASEAEMRASRFQERPRVQAAFDAFLGAPPAELHSEWCQDTSCASKEVVASSVISRHRQ